MQGFFHAQQLVTLAFQHLGDWNTSPLGDYFGHFLFRHAVAQQLVGFAVLATGGCRELLLQRRNDAVLELRHAVQVARAPRGLEIEARAFEIRLHLMSTGQGGFFSLPDFFQVGVFLLDFHQLRFEVCQPSLGGIVLLFAQRFAFDLELDGAAREAVHGLRLGVDLDADAAGRFINEVDGFVR